MSRTESIEAYDLPDRVRKYDADMDIMHPHRYEMIEVALDVLPFPRQQALRALDLGTGTGVFTQRFLGAYPAATVVAVDGAEAMLGLAAARLGPPSDRVTWVQADFLDLPSAIAGAAGFDVVITSYALHHLDAGQKLDLLKNVVAALAPGGWLLNADIVVAETADAERRIQQIRVDGVTARAPDDDGRFRSAAATRTTLDELEAAERDQPQRLSEDLRIFRQAGLENAEVYWKRYREVVIGGSIP